MLTDYVPASVTESNSAQLTDSLILYDVWYEPKPQVHSDDQEDGELTYGTVSTNMLESHFTMSGHVEVRPCVRSVEQCASTLTPWRNVVI